MEKETAIYAGWKVVRHDDNRMEVYKDGELCPKSAPELRKIAEALGMAYEEGWRTSQLGRNVIKAMQEAAKAPAAADSTEGEQMPLIEKLRYAFIVEDDDQVYYDAETFDEEYKTLFIENLRAQNLPEENEILDGMVYSSPEDFVVYLEEDPDDLNLASKIICAAYVMHLGYSIENDDPRIVREWTLYYFNDCMGLHYETESDIDLG